MMYLRLSCQVIDLIGLHLFYSLIHKMLICDVPKVDFYNKLDSISFPGLQFQSQQNRQSGGVLSRNPVDLRVTLLQQERS